MHCPKVMLLGRYSSDIVVPSAIEPISSVSKGTLLSMQAINCKRLLVKPLLVK